MKDSSTSDMMGRSAPTGTNDEDNGKFLGDSAAQEILPSDPQVEDYGIDIDGFTMPTETP